MQPSISKRITGEVVKSIFPKITTVLLDADGVLWEGSQSIPGSIEAFNKMVALGKRLIIVTNNSSKTREEYKRKCDSMGFVVPLENIMSTSYVTAWYLKKRRLPGKVYLVASEAVAKELSAQGVDHVGCGPDELEASVDIVDWSKSNLRLEPDVSAVVVGFDRFFNYMKLLKASSYVRGGGALFVATNEDQQMPVGERVVIPGTGSLVDAVSCAADRQPDVVLGKPHGAIIECLSEIQSIDPSETIMIGDRLNTDILFGANNDIRTVLVLTGCSRLEDVIRCEGADGDSERRQVPTFYAESLGEIGEML